MSFRVGKADVRLSLGVIPLFAVLIVLGEGRTLALSALSLALHELSHIIAARNLGYSLRRFSVYPFGAVMELNPLGAKPGGEWIAALSGPLGSFVIASAARLLGCTAPRISQALDPFVHTNAAIAMLNLLPAYPLDGGRIAKTLLTRALSERAARRVALLFTAVCAAALAVLGVFLIGKAVPAWTLLLVAPYLIVSALIEWKQADVSAVSRVLERRAARKTGAPMRAQIVLIGSEATVGEALQALSRRCFTILRIRTERGTVETDEDQLLDAASEFGYQTALKDIFTH